MPVPVPGGVRPGGEVGEGFAGDLLGGVAEQLLRVLVPGGDGAGAVDLDDGDADPGVGQRQQVGGEGGARGAGADRALGEVELEPDGLVGGRVVDAPVAGQGGAELEAASALAVGAAHVDRGALEGNLTLGIPVGHLDPHAVLAAQAEQLGGGARVHDGVGHEFAGQHHGVVDDVAEAPALEGVADEGAGARDGSSDGLEAGGRARGDHRTPRPVLDGHGSLAGRIVPLVRQAVRRPWVRGCSPGSVRWSCCAAAPPMPARSRATAQAGRAGVAGQPHARLLTFAVRADAGLQCFRPRCSPSGGVCGRCAKLPNCYGLVPRG